MSSHPSQITKFRDSSDKKAGEDAGKESLYSVLVELQVGAVTVEISEENLSKANHKFMI